MVSIGKICCWFWCTEWEHLSHVKWLPPGLKLVKRKVRRIKEIKVKSILKSKNYTRWSEVRHQQQERLTTNKV